MSGIELLKQLVAITGLPKEQVQNEVDKLIQKSGLNKESLTLPQLRLLLADYLQDVLLNAKKEFSE